MISEQLIVLMYGSIVNEVIDTSEHMSEANERLQKIGYKIGLRIVDDYLKESLQKPCTKLAELVDKFATIGVRKYLMPIDSRSQEYKQTEKGFSFNLHIIGNPLLKNLEMPVQLKNGNLQYQSIIKGAIRGAFQILKYKTQTILIYENLKSEKNQSIFFIDAVKA